MVLCRVIMGNMEVVLPGSKQFHPSSESFDSGVDDPENPRHYIVWSMNINTHIYPEYVVSFKVPANREGEILCLNILIDFTLSPSLSVSLYLFFTAHFFVGENFTFLISYGLLDLRNCHFVLRLNIFCWESHDQSVCTLPLFFWVRLQLYYFLIFT